MDTFKNIQPMINDIHKLHKLKELDELDEKDPNILSISTIKHYHNIIYYIDNDIKKRFDIFFRNNVLMPDLFTHYKLIERDYKTKIFNNNYYRHFLRLTSLENIGKSLNNNDYEFLNKYTNNIKKTYLHILDPNCQYINSNDVNNELYSSLSLCDKSLNELKLDNYIKQKKILSLHETEELKKKIKINNDSNNDKKIGG